VTILGFIGIAGFLFVDAFVFPYIDASLKETLTNGPTGIAIFASVIVYVLGVLLFTIASFRANVYPKLPLIFWGVGVAPTLAAIALPAMVMTVAEIVASIGIIWIGVAIWQGATTK
jgi:predicted RND superfamily exporter protein